MSEGFLDMQISNQTGTTAAPPFAANHRSFVSFRVDTQDFLVEAAHLLEIIMPLPVTLVPGAGNCVAGVIALHGEIVPLVNFRRLLGLNDALSTQETRFLIIRPAHEMFGIIIDSVGTLRDLADDQISAIAPVYAGQKFRVVSGMAHAGTLVCPIVDAQMVQDAVFLNGDCNAV